MSESDIIQKWAALQTGQYLMDTFSFTVCPLYSPVCETDHPRTIIICTIIICTTIICTTIICTIKVQQTIGPFVMSMSELHV